MNNQRTYQIILGVIAISLLVLFVYFMSVVNNKNQAQQSAASTSAGPYVDLSTLETLGDGFSQDANYIYEEKKLSDNHKEWSDDRIESPSSYGQLIENIQNVSKHNVFLRTTLNLDGQLKTVYAAFYPSNDPATIMSGDLATLNHPTAADASAQGRGGVVVFSADENISIIWESQENLYGPKGDLLFDDIDADGQNELILLLAQGVQLVPAMYVYKWNGDQYILINPAGKTLTERWMAGLDIKLRDIDNDHTKEIMTLNQDSDSDTSYWRIFKFDGSKYYLWKKTTEPVEN